MPKIPEKMTVMDADSDGHEFTVSGTPDRVRVAMGFRGGVVGVVNLTRDAARKIMRKLQSLTDARRE